MTSNVLRETETGARLVKLGMILVHDLVTSYGFTFRFDKIEQIKKSAVTLVINYNTWSVS